MKIVCIERENSTFSKPTLTLTLTLTPTLSLTLGCYVGCEKGPLETTFLKLVYSQSFFSSMPEV